MKSYSNYKPTSKRVPSLKASDRDNNTTQALGMNVDSEKASETNAFQL